MKNDLYGKICDFLIILSLYLAVAFSVFGANKLLYAEGNYDQELSIMTETVDASYKDYLKPGDQLFDTITKRCIGQISELDIIDTGTGIRFKISLTAKFMPRGEALRSANLWFRYTEL